MKNQGKENSVTGYRYLSNARNWAFENWMTYIFLKNIFFFIIPFLFLIALFSLITINSPNIVLFNVFFVISVLSYGVALVTCFLSDSQRVNVARRSPETYIFSERIDHGFAFLYLGLFSVIFAAAVIDAPILNTELIEIPFMFRAFFALVLASFVAFATNFELYSFERFIFSKRSKLDTRAV